MSQWYPHSCHDGTWQPRTKGGAVIKMYFESSAACMAYLRRSGLVPPTPGVTMVTPAAARFLEQWNKRDQRNRQMVLPEEGMTITPRQTSPAGPDGMPDDDRWEWIQTGTWDNPDQWTKGACRHKTPEPVDAYPTGELVAWLCVDCGQTFEPDRWPVPEGMWRRIPALFEGGPPGSLHKIEGQPVLRADDGPCPHHRCGERAYTCACQTCTKCNDELHDHWLVGGVILLAKETWGMFELCWNAIRGYAEIAWLCWSVILVAVWWVGIILGWWSE